MHHFPTREALLMEAVTSLALRLAEEALDEIDLAALQRPEHREAVLDQAWRQFTSPQALAALFTEWDQPTYRADQVLHWLYRDLVTGFEQMTNLPFPSKRARRS